ncbi:MULTISPECIES: hypothetical protein [Streptomyces]|uniref:Uncharacterized protein n=1 Tax=Streptomyces luteosporeus TaxID=173856 RepID=A0ABN3TXL1_9ACTN
MTSNTWHALENYVSARQELLDAMLADVRSGVSANDIADVARIAWSRPRTLEYINVRKLAARAREALTAAGLDGYVDVRTTGDLMGSRQALLQISCDPLDMEQDDWQELPDRIAGALVAAEIGWTVPGDLGPSLDALLDEVEHVELIDLSPAQA